MKSRNLIALAAIFGVVYSSNAADKPETAKPADEKKKIEIPAKMYRARIDINGIKEKIGLKPVRGMSNAGWLKKKNMDKNYLLSHSKPLGDVWEDMEVAFIPDKDGVVALSLRGAWWKPKGEKTTVPIWIEFDEVEITGAELKNGGFESIGKNGRLESWSFKGKLVSDKPAGGKNNVKVALNSPANQNIKVKEGQQVTIKAKVKKAE